MYMYGIEFTKLISICSLPLCDLNLQVVFTSYGQLECLLVSSKKYFNTWLYDKKFVFDTQTPVAVLIEYMIDFLSGNPCVIQ